jgi:hypothetical protein
MAVDFSSEIMEARRKWHVSSAKIKERSSQNFVSVKMSCRHKR